jgi:hypothetical protein
MPSTSLPARWFLANLAPLFIVVLVAATLDGRAGNSAVPLVGHLALVLSAAVGQAMVLRVHGVAVGRWIVATMIGFAVGLALGVGLLATLDGLGHEVLGMGLGTALLGAVLGSAQALAMRRERAGEAIWIAASASAWVVVGLLWLAGWHRAHGLVSGGGPLSPFTRLYEAGNAELLLLGIGLAGSSLFTGPVLARIVRGTA